MPEENLGATAGAARNCGVCTGRGAGGAAAGGPDFNTAVAGFEKKPLEQVLKESSNLREASRKLNINASTICRKIKQYGIDYENRRS